MKIGDTYEFVPAAWFGLKEGSMKNAVFGVPAKVTGRVVMINLEHRYCRVEYTLASGVVGHECFKLKQRALPAQQRGKLNSKKVPNQNAAKRF